MAVVGIYPVVGHFPALHMVILSPISRDVKQLLQQSNNLLINCPGFNFWGHWALSDYNICSFFEVTGFASRRWAASSYQAVFMGRRPMPRQRGLFVKSPLWNPEKQRLTFIVWIFSICSQDIKDHRTCRYPPSASRCARSAHREINPQNTAFGCKQLSGCIHGAPPHTPPKGTFCKKSPLESRKTAFDFYCLDCHPLLPRYQKAGVHAAYSPSASRCA